MHSAITRYLRLAALAGSSLLLVIDLCLLTYGVLARYFLGSSPIWMAELARFLIIGTALIGAGAVWVEGLHMRVGILERLVPGSAAAALHLYQWLLTLALAAFAAWVSWQYAWSVSAFQTMGLGISRTVPLLTLPAGFALLFVHALLRGPRPLPSLADTDDQAAESQS